MIRSPRSPPRRAPGAARAQLQRSCTRSPHSSPTASSCTPAYDARAPVHPVHHTHLHTHAYTVYPVHPTRLVRAHTRSGRAEFIATLAKVSYIVGCREYYTTCTMGHTICSSCRDKLPDKCCFCSLPTVYNRCHRLEDVVESIQLACSNSEHGCTARITHYQKDEHEKDCPHVPCFCPVTDCSFKGPTAMLLEHFSRVHRAPSTKFIYNEAFGVRIHGDAPDSLILVGEDGHVFMLEVEMESAGGVISICCVQPHITGSKFKCKLSIYCNETGYAQAAEFETRNTNLYDGMPKDFMFLVPKVLLQRAITTVVVTLRPQ
ncbi:E3 ubiquitin-protein ligase SINA-like 3 [Hordeum vulgare subsp. vulgare]|uniref:E3 ubiquitin-protein ligase SINA-like 3 n=1 Tax=Hordeum vulgare subsp. vulgare TaxID=112509 RepID=UPI001D1A4E9C|nr:E3 ubiquitin-protein ligase SINA-like 3 [Hordeum vulgare subsp. vulgare]XP_044973711.1 E3 ubiquitin-protein ligase SINA-like 3 [Hordeum vulgare subsp. vulgare]